MRLDLKILKNLDGESFIFSTILPKMKEYIVLNLNDERVNNFENYLKEKLKISYSLKEIMFDVIDTMIVDKRNDFTYSISTNDSLLLKDTSYTMSQLVRLIEYGDLNIRGLKLLSTIFRQIKSNIRALEFMYISNVQIEEIDE